MTRDEERLAALALRRHADHTKREARGRRYAGPTWKQHRSNLRAESEQALALAKRLEAGEEEPSTLERGTPDQDVYTFEAGPGVTLEYPDAELWTRDYQEARAYAEARGYKVICNSYEFEDSELLDDFTPEP